jgi:hypothetical protein
MILAAICSNNLREEQPEPWIYSKPGAMRNPRCRVSHKATAA